MRRMKVQASMKDPVSSEVQMLAVMDAKSLYDNLVREATGQAEKRAGLEVCVCRGSLDCMDGQARWTPHEGNIADCLTKVGGNSARLHDFMRHTFLKLEREGDVLAERKDFGEVTGRANPRPSKSGISERIPEEIDLIQMAMESIQKAPWE